MGGEKGVWEGEGEGEVGEHEVWARGGIHHPLA